MNTLQICEWHTFLLISLYDRVAACSLMCICCNQGFWGLLWIKLHSNTMILYTVLKKGATKKTLLIECLTFNNFDQGDVKTELRLKDGICYHLSDSTPVFPEQPKTHFTFFSFLHIIRFIVGMRKSLQLLWLYIDKYRLFRTIWNLGSHTLSVILDAKILPGYVLHVQNLTRYFIDSKILENNKTGFSYPLNSNYPNLLILT